MYEAVTDEEIAAIKSRLESAKSGTAGFHCDWGSPCAPDCHRAASEAIDELAPYMRFIARIEALTSAMEAERSATKKLIEASKEACAMALELTQKFARPESDEGYVFSNRVTIKLKDALSL